MLNLMEEMKRRFEVVVKDDEFFSLAAKMVRKSYLALIKEGFTKEEAIKILAGNSGVNFS